jgi:endogenous inhibitor of DNA gyrase (YacG/DUF329 family)
MSLLQQRRCDHCGRPEIRYPNSEADGFPALLIEDGKDFCSKRCKKRMTRKVVLEPRSSQ